VDVLQLSLADGCLWINTAATEGVAGRAGGGATLQKSAVI